MRPTGDAAAVVPVRPPGVPVARGDTVAEGDVVARLDSRVQETTFDLMEERAASRTEEGAQVAPLALCQSQRDRVQTFVEQVKLDDPDLTLPAGRRCTVSF